MSQAQDKPDKKKGFWSRLMDNLDKKMEAKAKSSSCCCCPSDPKSDQKTCS
jgi:hypothetical protein